MDRKWGVLAIRMMALFLAWAILISCGKRESESSPVSSTEQV